MADNERIEPEKEPEEQTSQTPPEAASDETAALGAEENGTDIPEQYREKKVRKLPIILLIIVLLIALGTVWTIYQNTQLEKSFYQVQSNKVVDNVRIVCISDMHLKEFGTDNERLVTEIKNLSPDLIAVVGDMNMEEEPDNYGCVVTLVKELNKTAPVYYSLGNHEIDAMLFGDSNIYDDIKKEGIKIFNNETETVEIKGNLIDVIGLTQNPKEFYEYGLGFFYKAMEKDPEHFKLVLTHYPENFQGVLDEYNIDLALSGHAHGGQVRLPIIGGLYSADQGIFPELCDGYHEIGNSKLIITRGLGKSGLVPRINNKPEIAAIDIGWY